MKSTYNTLPFVCNLMQSLVAANVQTWLFGGWAEELWGLCPPRVHRDVDLLYPASDFQLLDQWIGRQDEVESIEGKHFHHKRAVNVRQVLIEFFLLEPGPPGGYNINYFGDKYQLKWPIDALVYKQLENGYKIGLAGVQALQDYRSQHGAIKGAYQAYKKDKHA